MTISRARMGPTLGRHSRKVTGVGAEKHVHAVIERRQRKCHSMGILHPLAEDKMGLDNESS